LFANLAEKLMCQELGQRSWAEQDIENHERKEGHWHEIAIALILDKKGEGKAHTCEMAAYNS
jgi:hypothetical protein